MTITCPQCHEPHALYWQRWGDNTRHLYYRCNKMPVILNQHHAWKLPKMRLSSRQVMVEDPILIIKAKKLGGEIPELWNKTKTRKNQEQEQMKLI
jgi:hypothetical protein